MFYGFEFFIEFTQLKPINASIGRQAIVSYQNYSSNPSIAKTWEKLFSDVKEPKDFGITTLISI